MMQPSTSHTLPVRTPLPSPCRPPPGALLQPGADVTDPPAIPAFAHPPHLASAGCGGVVRCGTVLYTASQLSLISINLVLFSPHDQGFIVLFLFYTCLT